MDNEIKIVKNYYDENVESEWERLQSHPFEFMHTVKMMDAYIKEGDKVLDIGGGPGRYSLYYASKGCDVTLFDLSPENIEFAKQKAFEQNLKINAISGDAREVDKIIDGKFDHVFIMGPMYHLLEENDRITVMNAALSKLKDNGKLYVSFIQLFSGIIYEMKYAPEMITLDSEMPFIESVLNNTSYGGDAFTKAHFVVLKDIISFLSQFALKKLHLFAQEGILSPCESNIMAQPQNVIDKWFDISFALCEREDLIGFSEHLMYIGQFNSL